LKQPTKPAKVAQNLWSRCAVYHAADALHKRPSRLNVYTRLSIIHVSCLWAIVAGCILLGLGVKSESEESGESGEVLSFEF
jgi:hypothetical protein